MISKVIDRFDDLLRPNYFEVLIEPPQQLSRYDQPLLKFLVLSTDFPFETIEPTVMVSSSQKRKFANDISFASLPLTFRLDSDGRILEFFQRWRNLVVSDDHRMGYYDDYIGTVIIKMLDKQKNEIYTAKLVECFPVNRSAISLSYDSTDQFSQLTVNFEYMLIEYARAGEFLSSQWFDMVTGITDQIKLPFGLDNIFRNPFEDKVRELLRAGDRSVSDAFDRLGLPPALNAQRQAQQTLTRLQKGVMSRYNITIPTTVTNRIKNVVPSLPRLRF